MIFENIQVRLSDLPSVQSVDFQRLAPAYRNVEYIATSIFFGFLFLGWLLFFIFNRFDLPWLEYGLLGGWTALFAFSMYLAGRRYESEGYAIRERDIIHRRGILTRTVTTIPFNRMQHCEISQGPVESAFGLATLRVFTAGGSSSDLEIEGLPHEEAVRIKEFITTKIGEQKETF
jgi:hypothetical protein